MPYYNNRDVIKRSIDSVVNQSYKKFELIIINDGSTEDIRDIVDSYKDERILYYVQENTGVSGARNRGIKKAHYEWICFLDSDDTWESYHLEEMARLIHKYSDIRFFITSYKRTGNNVFYSNSGLPNSYPNDFVTDNLLGKILQFGELIHTNSVCMNKRLFIDCGYFVEGVSIGEDTDLWYRVSMRYPVVVSKRTTSEYHRDASFLTKKTLANIKWPFIGRNELIKDESIPVEKRESMKIIVIRAQLSSCKHLIEEKKFKKAEQLFKSIKSDIPDCLKKSKWEVLILLKMPQVFACNLARLIYRRQHKNF